MLELARIARIENPRDLHHPVQNLPVIHPHDVIPARDAHGLQRVGEHRADLGIRGDRRRANGVRVALVELPEAARPGLFIAPDRPHGEAAVGRGQVIAELGRDAGQGRGHVIAQRHPFAVILLLPGENAGIGPVHVGQVLAKRLDGFHGRGFERIEAVAMVDLGDAVQHLLAFGHLGAEIVAEALGRLCLGAGLFLLLGHRCYPLGSGSARRLAQRALGGKAALWSLDEKAPR